jgi:hypothetical protein
MKIPQVVPVEAGELPLEVDEPAPPDEVEPEDAAGLSAAFVSFDPPPVSFLAACL